MQGYCVSRDDKFRDPSFRDVPSPNLQVYVLVALPAVIGFLAPIAENNVLSIAKHGEKLSLLLILDIKAYAGYTFKKPHLQLIRTIRMKKDCYTA